MVACILKILMFDFYCIYVLNVVLPGFQDNKDKEAEIRDYNLHKQS